MSEGNKNAKLNLHRIEGFNPELELNEIKILDEYGEVAEKRYYLPLATKETWFWLTYPDGAIRTRTLQVTDSYVKAECRLYRHYKDAENEYFVSAEKIMNIDYLNPFYYGRGKEEIIGGYINSAKAAAESIALTKGGFGIQIESPDESGLFSDKSYEDSVKKIPVPKKPAKESKGETNKPTIPVPQKADEVKKKEMDEKLANQKSGNTFVPFHPEKSDKQEITTPFIQQHQMNEESTATANYAQQKLFDENSNGNEVCHGDTVAAEPQKRDTDELIRARGFVVTSPNPKFNQKTLGEIFDLTPFAVPYIAHNSQGEQREAAILLSRSKPDTNAKLEQFLGR